VARLLSDEGPVPLHGPSKLLLHFVPAAALAGRQVTGPWPVPDSVRGLLRPSSMASNAVGRYNADGFLIYSPHETNLACASYVQIFRNGCLEYGDGEILNTGRLYGAGRETEVPSASFEQLLVETYGNALLVITRIGIEDPVYFSCTLAGVQGLRLTRSGNPYIDHLARHTFDRQIVQTPEVLVDRAESRPYRNSALQVVNSIWQANGYQKSPFEGDW